MHFGVVGQNYDRNSSQRIGCCSVTTKNIRDGQTLVESDLLCRPPGHHASPDESNGFCLYNNVAIGAKYVMKKYGTERCVALFNSVITRECVYCILVYWLINENV